MEKFLAKRKRENSTNSDDEFNNISYDNSESLSTKPKQPLSKVDIRAFQESWTTDYFFIPIPNGTKPQCLLCDEVLSENRKTNVERHYQTKHKSAIEKDFPPNSRSRTLYVNQLKDNLIKQRCVLKSALTESECVTLASYQLSMKIAISQKPFTEGEFVKSCFLDIANILFSDMKNKDTIIRKIQELSLSHQTIQRRLLDISDDLKDQFKLILKNSISFSLAFDESTDSTDSAQLCIWFRCIDSNFNINTEILSLISLTTQTRGIDIYNAFQSVLEFYNLDMSKLFVVATDGAASMTGPDIGFVSLLRKSLNAHDIIGLHCIIHIESLCAKMGLAELNDIINSVSKLINYIKSHALIHREFMEFLSILDSDYSDLLYYTDVRWLSRGNMSERFLKLLPQITEFLKSKNLLESLLRNEKFPPIEDENFILKLAFLVDITVHLNNLNTSLQGRDNLLFDAVFKIIAFKEKLAHYRDQFVDHNFLNFPNFQTCNMPLEFDPQFYILILDSLILEFDQRFDIETFQFFELCAKFLKYPQNFPINKLSVLATFYKNNLRILENELIEFKAEHNDRIDDVIELWKFSKYNELRFLAAKILSTFSSTYVCESSFSTMNNLKSKLRSRLLNESLESQLICSVTKLEPRFLDLVRNKNCKISH